MFFASNICGIILFISATNVRLSEEFCIDFHCKLSGPNTYSD